jgi:alpha-soluble NSF attachment protein
MQSSDSCGGGNAGGRQEDIVSAIEKYMDLDITFDGSRECKLLQDCATAMDGGDQQAFTNAIAEYDSLTRLDPWKTSLLLTAKKLIVSRENDDEEDLT